MLKIDNVIEYLNKNKIKPSYQRLRIFEYLNNNRDHPTVDKIYKELIYDIPTLSKTTVYNTLKLFVNKGLVRMVTIEDNEVRYDADISLHGHFKCEKCGQIYDFEIDPSSINSLEIKSFQIKETHMYIKGICDKCDKQ